MSRRGEFGDWATLGDHRRDFFHFFSKSATMR